MPYRPFPFATYARQFAETVSRDRFAAFTLFDAKRGGIMTYRKMRKAVSSCA